MRLRDDHSDKVVPEARNLNNPAQAERSGAQCGVESLSHLLRACRRYATVLLLTLLMAAGGNSAKAQGDSCIVNVVRTYINGRQIPWDSIRVRVNLNNPSYFTMYPPDTILANCPTGIHVSVPSAGSSLLQSYPNPCEGECHMKLTTCTAGNVHLQIMDMQGRLCCQRTGLLSAGEHLLSITLPYSGMYFVQAETTEGRKVGKVLCTSGRGSGFDIRMSSSTPKLMEKAERGGEGLFNGRTIMWITAYITYGGRVLKKTEQVNYYITDWLYPYGSVNIFFSESGDCGSFSLAGKSYTVVSASLTLPTMTHPITYRVTFGDSTFYSEPTELAPYSSPSWPFSGEYKYRYYPEDLGGCICIGDINEEMPSEHLPYYVVVPNYWIRKLEIISCDDFKILRYDYDWTERKNEYFLKEE